MLRRSKATSRSTRSTLNTFLAQKERIIDNLRISGLKIPAKIGVHAWEQRIQQYLLLDIVIEGNFSACEDKLENTIDYAALCQDLTEFVGSKSFALIETVAQEVALRIKHKHPQYLIKIGVTKPYAVSHAQVIQVNVEL